MCLRIPPALWQSHRAAELLRSYWAVRWDGTPACTGSRFERLGGGGDRLSVANRFTADDVIAVTTLGVSIPATAALQLLEPDPAHAFSELLAQLPVTAQLVDVDASLIGREGPAWQLWERLNDLRWIGPVIAGKLMARKRPALFPVYDSVIKWVFDRPENDLLFWSDMRCELQADDGRLITHLERARTTAGLGDDISVLRVLDTMAWHYGKEVMPSRRQLAHPCPPQWLIES
ncbi:DUF6308 family protein [Streptomyces sp. NPDC002055]|uniref:DUF6308 family protein n=1 Tax=Streptomyces sp. NPDC002055 TaxID=3154534 RepID=UPI003319B5C3